MSSGRIIGIDLGTSTSEVAYLDNGRPRVIPDKNGNVITPSVVGIVNGEIQVGAAARDQFILKPEDTVIEVKRLMGSGQKVTMGGKEYTPQQISSFIIRYLKEYAESFLGETIDRAVITVPAYFTDEQRRATLEAGELAGLKVERIINEPTAAALTYGIDHMEDNHYALVYDLGGGTLDVTVLELFDGVLEVKASSGNNHLGGKDFDERLMNWLIEGFAEKYGIDLRSDARAMTRLKEAAEAAKIALSSELSYDIVLPFIAEKDGSPVALETTINRAQFEDLIRDLVESTRQPIEIALSDAGLTPDDLDVVLLIGGSTRIPLVQRFLHDVLNIEPRHEVDPDLAVAMGAAIQAGILSEELSPENDILITDVCPYTLGISAATRIGGTVIPGIFDILIPRNTTIPVTKEKDYYTLVDNQREAKIEVYQGEHRIAERNNLIGLFILEGIPPAPAGKEAVRVKFSYDVNGILQVDATIVSTGKAAGIKIETAAASTASEENLEAWKDAPLAKRVRALVRSAERMLKREDLDPLTIEALQDLLHDLKEAVIANDEDAVESIEEELNDLLYELEEEDDE